MGLVFHKLVQRDLRIVLSYYEEEGGSALADRFFRELDVLVHEIESHPARFRKVAGKLRRADLKRFPYHLLFTEGANGIRVLVLRHHRRNPRFGMQRR